MRQVSNKLAIEIPQDMKDQLLKKEFFDKMFATMVADVPIKGDTSGKSHSGFDFKKTIRTYFQKV